MTALNEIFDALRCPTQTCPRFNNTSNASDVCGRPGNATFLTLLCNTAKTEITRIEVQNLIVDPLRSLSPTAPAFLSSWIGVLTSLLRLQVDVADLTGPIPSQLGKLTRLETLSVFNNSLNGTLPSTIKACRQLSYLRISSNDFEGTLPDVGQFPNITSLSLYGNANLVVSIPAVTWQSLSKLTFLNAARTFWQPSPLPSDVFAKMTSLNKLSLNTCRLNGSLPNDVIQHNMSLLDLGGNSFSGTVPLAWGNFSRGSTLSSLTLTNNKLSGDLAHLGNLTALRVLQAGGNSFNGSAQVFRNLVGSPGTELEFAL